MTYVSRKSAISFIATLEQALQDAQSSIRTLRANVVERSEELRKTKIALDATKDLEAKVEELTTMVSVREEAIRALEAEKAELVETLTSVRKSAREDSKRLAELLATEEQLESKVSMYTQGMRDLMAKYSSKRTAYEAEIAGTCSIRRMICIGVSIHVNCGD